MPGNRREKSQMWVKGTARTVEVRKKGAKGGGEKNNVRPVYTELKILSKTIE